MLYLTASARMVIVSVTLGLNSIKNFCRKWGMNQKQKQIMNYILKKEEAVYSVNCGFR